MITIKKYLLFTLVVLASLNVYSQCNGSANCSTCTNCVRCRHCKAGGVCGVCSPESFKSKKGQPKVSIQKTNKNSISSNNNRKDSLEFKNPTPVYQSSSETIVKEEKKQDIYTVVEEMPEFPGGSIEMTKYIQKNLRFPETAKANGVTGKCFTKFIINEGGKVEDVKIIKGVPGCEECDEEAIRVLESMPLWKAGKQNNKPVPVYFNLPINFQNR